MVAKSSNVLIATATGKGNKRTINRRQKSNNQLIAIAMEKKKSTGGKLSKFAVAVAVTTPCAVSDADTTSIAVAFTTS